MRVREEKWRERIVCVFGGEFIYRCSRWIK